MVRRSFFSLLRWLGPWTRDTTVPSGITREAWVIREGAMHGLRAFERGLTAGPDEPRLLDAYVYRAPGEPLGLYVVAPGLHYAGPDDPRFDRFCRILARAGFVVVAPFLASYVDLQVAPHVVDDFEVVVEAATRRFPAFGRPSIFSISFGSFPSLVLAARRPELIDGIVTFGGYADFDSVARFCVDGVVVENGQRVALEVDPTNLPAVFLNLVRHLPIAGDPKTIERAWKRLCYATWGRPELKDKARIAPVADALARELPPSQRELFRIGAGIGDGAHEVVDRALRVGAKELAFLDPNGALAGVRCPVVVCHGRDDDVVPYLEAEKLHRALALNTRTQLHLTGLYSHTGQGGTSLGGTLHEAATLLRVTRAISDGGRLDATVTSSS